MIVSSSGRQQGKTEAAIRRLPDKPKKQIVWIVYNNDMVEFTRSQIARIKGEEYLRNYVIVTPRSTSSKYNGQIVFDPRFFDLEGNGFN